MMRMAALALMLSAAPALALTTRAPDECRDDAGTTWYFHKVLPEVFSVYNYDTTLSYVAFCEPQRAIRYHTDGKDAAWQAVGEVLVAREPRDISDVMQLLRDAGATVEDVPLDAVRCVCDPANRRGP